MAGVSKILLVEDDPTNILFLKGMLRKMGHETVGVANAHEALDGLDRSFDLVIADVMMPEMSGFLRLLSRKGSYKVWSNQTLTLSPSY